MKITIFPGKYHQNCGFSRAMLVYRRVLSIVRFRKWKTPGPTPLPEIAHGAPGWGLKNVFLIKFSGFVISKTLNVWCIYQHLPPKQPSFVGK